MLERLTFPNHRLVFIYYYIIPNINDSLRTVDPILSLSVYFCLWFSTDKVLTTLCIIMELSGPLSTLTTFSCSYQTGPFSLWFSTSSSPLMIRSTNYLSFLPLVPFPLSLSSSNHSLYLISSSNHPLSISIYLSISGYRILNSFIDN